MLGADPLGPRDTIVLGGGRPKRSPEGQAHYGILKQFRRIATRYEKRGVNYRAMLTIGMILLWL